MHHKWCYPFLDIKYYCMDDGSRCLVANWLLRILHRMHPKSWSVFAWCAALILFSVRYKCVVFHAHVKWFYVTHATSSVKQPMHAHYTVNMGQPIILWKITLITHFFMLDLQENMHCMQWCYCRAIDNFYCWSIKALVSSLGYSSNHYESIYSWMCTMSRMPFRNENYFASKCPIHATSTKIIEVYHVCNVLVAIEP